MDYEINDEYGYKDDYSYLDDVLKKALEIESVDNAIFSIIFIDEKKIKELNRDYRNNDKVTDVISFALEDSSDKVESEFRFLGDIYVCIPKMIEQAEEYGHSIKRELSFLCVHGLLHLLGYDHMVKEEEEVMFSRQELILNEAGIKR